MPERKYQFRTRQAAEDAARDLQTQRDNTAIALQAAVNGAIEWIGKDYGREGSFYRFGLIARVAGCVVVVSFHCPETGQSTHSAAYWESWIQEEINRFSAIMPENADDRAYREGLYDLRQAVNEANNRPLYTTAERRAMAAAQPKPVVMGETDWQRFEEMRKLLAAWEQYGRTMSDAGLTAIPEHLVGKTVGMLDATAC